MAQDAAQANIARYKGGFTTNSSKKDFCKTTPLKIVPGMSSEQIASLGLKQMKHPTPTSHHKT